jgi:hypothetical protein
MSAQKGRRRRVERQDEQLGLVADLLEGVHLRG